MELGIYTFVELTPDPSTGAILSPAQRLRDLMEEVELADEVGLDVFGIGEHHRPDYLASAPSVVLAAAAERTKRIRLTSAVTVLSSDDPVRVWEQYSTVDQLSEGRAEIMVGRGSFIESFPLFGYDLAHYDELFAEKLGLLLQIRDSERITWSGAHRAALQDQAIYPRPYQEKLPIWVAVGGNPPSAIRAGTLGLPMALAIIGGLPERFVPFVDLYRASGQQAGLGPSQLKVSINSHGFIADTSQSAADLAFGPFKQTMDRIGRERGWPPMSRIAYESSRVKRGANFIGSPQEVIEKILFQEELFHHDRFLLQLSVGTMPHAAMMRAIELYGTVVAPAVRKALAHRTLARAEPASPVEVGL